MSKLKIEIKSLGFFLVYMVYVMVCCAYTFECTCINYDAYIIDEQLLVARWFQDEFIYLNNQRTETLFPGIA